MARLILIVLPVVVALPSGCANTDTTQSPAELPSTRPVGEQLSPTAVPSVREPRLPSASAGSGGRLAVLPDGDLGIDCTPIRSAIAARRAEQQWGANADAEALALLNEAPHQYVSPDNLVEFLLPAVGHGRESGIGLDEQKMYVRMKLCDHYYREVVTRQFVAQYPSFR